ncbi:MAG TPA: hypothetical protein VGC64_00565 [Pyrinomonadaceae bacterium]|jgi:hypothetical protein
MITKSDDGGSERPEASRPVDDSGDVVESAGETTAADTISGPVDRSPVGAQTMVKVDDSAEPAPAHLTREPFSSN